MNFALTADTQILKINAAYLAFEFHKKIYCSVPDFWVFLVKGELEKHSLPILLVEITFGGNPIHIEVDKGVIVSWGSGRRCKRVAG